MAEHHEFKSQHFLKEIEQAVQVANREILSQRLPSMTKENILPLAISVARLRGQYLAEAFKIAESDGGDAPTSDEISSLKENWQMRQDARLMTVCTSLENDMNNCNSTAKRRSASEPHNDNAKTRKKREELSISAAKSIKKEKVESLHMIYNNQKLLIRYI